MRFRLTSAFFLVVVLGVFFLVLGHLGAQMPARSGSISETNWSHSACTIQVLDDQKTRTVVIKEAKSRSACSNLVGGTYTIKNNGTVTVTARKQ